jgi:hypothetical protein
MVQIDPLSILPSGVAGMSGQLREQQNKMTVRDLQRNIPGNCYNLFWLPALAFRFFLGGVSLTQEIGARSKDEPSIRKGRYDSLQRTSAVPFL